MNWFTYELPPIDLNWELLHTVEDIAKTLAAREAAFAVKEGRPPNGAFALTVDELLKLWESAKGAADQAGWDGDFRIEPRVLPIPDETAFRVGFVFKQDNNGTTYVVSPVEMPHLDEYS